MVDESILASVRNYLRALLADGIEVSFGVLFGSWADGRADQDSDIDVMVVSPRFNGGARREDRVRLAIRTTSRPEQQRPRHMTPAIGLPAEKLRTYCRPASRGPPLFE